MSVIRLLFLLFLINLPLYGTDGLHDYTNLGKSMHYIRSDATGNNNGSDWTNAWTELPANLIRDDVYFIADGDYDWPNLDDAESGTDSIFIVKATVDDHGTSTGWSSAYGDGVATTTGFRINSGYWAIDGQIRTDGTSGYGFKVAFSGTCAGSQLKQIYLNSGHNVVLAYIEIQHCGYSYSGGQGNMFIDAGSDNVTIQYCWMHDVNGIHIYSFYCTDLIVEYCWFTERYNADSYGVHGESFTVYGDNNSMGHIYRYNVFRNVEGTGIIIIQNSGSGGYDIYGNIFYNDVDHILDGQTSADPNPSISDFDCNNGSIADTGPYVNSNVNMFNNTFVDLEGNTGLGINNSGYSNIVARNNIWVDCDNVIITANTASDNTINGSPSVFVNYSLHNYHLISGLGGYALQSPYNIDMDGNTRGLDGVWDRGAFEFNANVSTPTKPRGLVIRTID